MASQIGSLFVSLTADVQPFVRAMSRAERETAQATGSMRRDVGLTERSVESFRRTASSGGFKPYAMIAASRAFRDTADRVALLRGALLATTAVFGGFTAALSSNIILRYADSYVKLSNQIRVTSENSADLAARLEAVAQVAQETRSGLRETAVLFSRLATAAPGRSATEILNFVTTIQQALQLGGATAQEAASAAVQFSQALASNRLQGEELRAILETPLGRQLARGLDVTIGKLREMGTAGELTSDVILKALTRVAPQIAEEFAASALTIDQAFTVADNKLQEYIGRVDQAFGGTKLLSGAILAFANNLETIIPIATAVVGLLGAGFAGRIAGGRVGGFLQGFRDRADEAREKVAALREQTDRLSESFVGAAAKATAARRAAAGDVTSFISPAGRKEMERASARLEKLDEQRLALNDRLQQSYRDLAAVTAQSSARAVAASERQARAELSVATALQQERQLRRELALARTRELGALATQAISPVRVTAVKETGKARLEIEKEIARTQVTAAREQEKAEKASLSLSQLTSESERKAADVRLSKLREINALKLQAIDIDESRGFAAIDAQTAKQEALATGQRAASRAALEAAAAQKQFGVELNTAQGRLAAAERQTTRSAQAFNFLKAQGASLVGLFGGPWGIVITGAIALIGLLGARAAESAQKTAQAQDLIRRKLEDLGKTGGATAAAANEAFRGLQIKAVKDQIDAVTAALKDAQNAFALAVGARPAEMVTARQQEAYRALRGEIEALKTQLIVGAITQDEFNKRVQALDPRGFERVKEGAIATVGGILNASIALKGYVRDLDELERGSEKAAIASITEARALAVLNEQQKKRVATSEAIAGLEEELRISDLRAKGLTVEARAQEIANKYAAEGVRVDVEALIPILRLIEANNALAASLTNVSAAEQKAISFRKAEAASMQELAKFQQEAVARGVALTRGLEQQIQIAEMRRKGLIGEANAQEDINRAREEGVPVNEQQIIQLHKQLEATNAATKANKALGRSYKELQESARERLDDLKVENATIGMATDKAAAYRFEQDLLNEAAREGIPLTAAQKEGIRALAQEYGKLSLETEKAHAKQQLIAQASDQIAGAFGEFTKSAILGTDSLEDAAKRLLDRLIEIGFELLVILPLVNALKSGISTSLGGPPVVGASLFQRGGTVGAGVPSRKVPAGLFPFAPRFARGLYPGEFPAILHRGEEVLTKQVAGRAAGVISGFAKGAMGGGEQTVVVNNNTPEKAEVRRHNVGGQNIIEVVIGKIGEAVATGRMDAVFGSRFGAQPIARGR